jgi:hypothetical protein
MHIVIAFLYFYYFPVIFITVKLRYKIQEMSTCVILGYKIKIWHCQISWSVSWKVLKTSPMKFRSEHTQVEHLIVFHSFEHASCQIAYIGRT